MFASKLLKGYWLIFALIITAGYLYLISVRSDVSLVYQIAVYSFAGIIALYMLWAFFIFFIDTF